MCVAALAWPAIACAGTVDVVGTTLTYTATLGESNNLTVYNGPAGQIRITENNPGGVVTPAGVCTTITADTANCPSAGVTDFNIDLSDLDDSVEVTVTPALPGTILGGVGNDYLISGPGNETLDGGPGEDRIGYVDATGPAVIDLGGGTGSATGAGNDLLNGFEDVFGSGFGDTVTGDAGPNLISTFAGGDNIEGGDGSDIIQSGDNDDTVQGGPGNDQLNGELGDDFVDGEADDDTIVASDGSDTLAGVNGTDTVDYSAQPGALVLDLVGGTASKPGGTDVLERFEVVIASSFDDRIIVRDGAPESITCGLGADAVDADISDTPNLDCETIAPIATGPPTLS
ncbi:MAG: hypothetical protein QOJ29_465, partial [Thermoleophilaceae bacterium]|nr:hypothetical protein [Thermoleophilaceae bacterium]